MDNSLQSSNGNPYRTVAGVPGKRAKDIKAVFLERNFRNRFFSEIWASTISYAFAKYWEKGGNLKLV